MSTVLKLFKIYLHVMLISIAIYMYINKKTSVKSLVHYDRFIQDLRYVLLWNKVKELDGKGQKIFITKNCQHINCYLTDDTNLFGDEKLFDAIIFNSEDLNTIDLPKSRAQHQKYIFYSKNTSEVSPICDPKFDNFFNWTWTYRRNSEIKISHYTILNSVGEDLGDSDNFKWLPNVKTIDNNLRNKLKYKRKAAAWFADDCTTVSKREIFMKNLRKELVRYNLTVDIFGDCGAMKCRRKTMAACYWKLKRLYYFYLALEDSIEEDYVTNEVVHAVRSNTVPIVYGGADYSKFLPPGSYLDGRRLGVKKLAEKMYQAIRNREEYHDYFKWRVNYFIREKQNAIDVCNLCEKLNNLQWLNFNMIYMEFRDWWNVKNNCGINEKSLV